MTRYLEKGQRVLIVDDVMDNVYAGQTGTVIRKAGSNDLYWVMIDGLPSPVLVDVECTEVLEPKEPDTAATSFRESHERAWEISRSVR